MSFTLSSDDGKASSLRHFVFLWKHEIIDKSRGLLVLVHESRFHVSFYPSVKLHHQSFKTIGIILLHNANNSVKQYRCPGTWSPASHRRSSDQFQADSRGICGGRSVIRTGVSQNTSAFPCHYHSTNPRSSFIFHRRCIVWSQSA